MATSNQFTSSLKNKKLSADFLVILRSQFEARARFRVANTKLQKHVAIKTSRYFSQFFTTPQQNVQKTRPSEKRQYKPSSPKQKLLQVRLNSLTRNTTPKPPTLLLEVQCETSLDIHARNLMTRRTNRGLALNVPTCLGRSKLRGTSETTRKQSFEHMPSIACLRKVPTLKLCGNGVGPTQSWTGPAPQDPPQGAGPAFVVGGPKESITLYNLSPHIQPRQSASCLDLLQSTKAPMSLSIRATDTCWNHPLTNLESSLVLQFHSFYSQWHW